MTQPQLWGSVSDTFSKNPINVGDVANAPDYLTAPDSTRAEIIVPILDDACSRVVGTIDEIPPGQRKIVDVAGRTIGVFNVGGDYFALLNRCPHQGGPLCSGRPRGRGAICSGRWRSLVPRVWIISTR